MRRLLSQGEVGDVQMVRGEFGLPVGHVHRMADRRLGGGGLVDLGIYPLQFAFMVFNGEKPESIEATGHCLDTGAFLKKVGLRGKYLSHEMLNLLNLLSVKVKFTNSYKINKTKLSTLEYILEKCRKLKSRGPLKNTHNRTQTQGET